MRGTPHTRATAWVGPVPRGRIHAGLGHALATRWPRADGVPTVCRPCAALPCNSYEGLTPGMKADLEGMQVRPSAVNWLADRTGHTLFVLMHPDLHGGEG